MQKLTEIRRRADTVRSIRSVANTMSAVASAKLSRTRGRAAGMRLYTERMRRVIRRQQAAAVRDGADLSALSPLMQPRAEVREVLLVHLAGDRGLCGAYNYAIDREARAFLRTRADAGVRVSVFAKGMEGERFLRRRCRARMAGAEPWARAGVTSDEVDRLYQRVIAAFLDGPFDEVWCTYTRFYSPLRREPTAVRLLPLAFEADQGDAATGPPRWFYEPDRARIVSELVARFARLQVEDVLLESYASEQGARMIAMEEATERAARSLQELTVAYNRLRREHITSDLLGVLFARTIERGPQATPQGGGRA